MQPPSLQPDGCDQEPTCIPTITWEYGELFSLSCSLNLTHSHLTLYSPFIDLSSFIYIYHNNKTTVTIAWQSSGRPRSAPSEERLHHGVAVFLGDYMADLGRKQRPGRSW